MKNLIMIVSLLACLTPAAHADTDREQIKAAMDCFYRWDHHGGAENSSQCISDTVLYHRVNENGEHSYDTPQLDRDSGKGEDAVMHNLLDIKIYTDMAITMSLNRYTPEGPNNTYIKSIVLHKLADGWRITNVFWGRVTNTQ